MPKRTIKIPENELESIIKETLIRHLSNDGRNVLYRIEEEIPNLKSIVENILSDYDSFINVENGMVDEGLIKSYDIEKVKDIVCRRFNLAPWQFTVKQQSLSGNNVNVAVLFLNKDINKNDEGDIENLMRTCGYHIANKPRFENGFKIVVFTPFFSRNISKRVKMKYKCLYHATPAIYVEKILKNGLEPKSKNKLYMYPDRVHCMVGDNLTRLQKDILRTVQRRRGENNILDDNKFFILKIDTSKLPDNTNFYVDAMAPESIYTYDNIPPKAISVYGELEQDI